MDTAEVVDNLTDEQAGQLLKAMFDFNRGKEPKLKNPLGLVFIPIKNAFIRNNEKWENIRKRNIKNGKKGGRPSLNKNPKKPTGLSGNPKNPVNVNVNANVSVKDINKTHIVAHEVQPHVRKPLDKATQLQRIVYHLEDTLKTTIVNWGKQAKALSMMLKAGYTEDQIKKTINYMASRDEFFGDKGFDLMTVANSISRYKAQSNRNGI